LLLGAFVSTVALAAVLYVWNLDRVPAGDDLHAG
jgi:hypothetical protein